MRQHSDAAPKRPRHSATRFALGEGRPLARTIAFLVPIGAALFVAIWLLNSGKSAPRGVPKEPVYELRVIELGWTEFVPIASGFGQAQADRTWRAVARVDGQVASVRNGLRAGSRVDKGTLAVQLDSMDVEIELASARSVVARLKADLGKLAAEERNLERSASLARQVRAVAERQHSRVLELVTNNAASSAEAETKERALLEEATAVLEIENSLHLIPMRRDSLNAELEGARTELGKAQRQLEFCSFRAPFSGSVGAVSVDVGQYVAPQEVLFELYEDGRTSVDAAFSRDQLARVFGNGSRDLVGLHAPAAAAERAPHDDVQATVTVAEPGREISWPATIVGTRERVDADTRARLLTVLVTQHSTAPDLDPGRALARGALCRVDLRGRPEQALVVPRSTVRDQTILVVDGESRVRRVPVDVRLYQGSLAVLRGGIEPGTLVLASLPYPTLEGSLVSPVMDEALQADITSEARGRLR